jgi:hypothetical protein
MADHQHIETLGQGAEKWNEWRKSHPGLRPNLTGADLRKRSLRNYDLSSCDLSSVDARDVSFRRANLVNANLNSAKLYRAFFSGTEVAGASFRKAVLYETVFANVDLTGVIDLDACLHKGASVVDHRTLARSHAIPLAFLRGCGLPDALIAETGRDDSSMRRYWSCFISYSSRDREFAERLYEGLQNNGVRCWYAPEDLQMGAKIRVAIDEAIRESGKVLLVLSANALASRWVEKEFETAFDEEQRRGDSVLFPIRIDDSPLTDPRSWVADIRRTLNIGDFSAWRENSRYQTAFSRLLHSLERRR